MAFRFNPQPWKEEEIKEVFFCIGLMFLIFICCIGAFIGGIIGCVVGAIGVPMMILDGQALNPVEAMSNLLNIAKDKI